MSFRLKRLKSDLAIVINLPSLKYCRKDAKKRKKKRRSSRVHAADALKDLPGAEVPQPAAEPAQQPVGMQLDANGHTQPPQPASDRAVPAAEPTPVQQQAAQPEVQAAPETPLAEPAQPRPELQAPKADAAPALQPAAPPAEPAAAPIPAAAGKPADAKWRPQAQQQQEAAKPPLPPPPAQEQQEAAPPQPPQPSADEVAQAKQEAAREALEAAVTQATHLLDIGAAAGEDTITSILGTQLLQTSHRDLTEKAGGALFIVLDSRPGDVAICTAVAPAVMPLLWEYRVRLASQPQASSLPRCLQSTWIWQSPCVCSRLSDAQPCIWAQLQPTSYVPAEDLDKAIEQAVDVAVGAKYAKKVRKRLHALLEPSEAEAPTTGAAAPLQPGVSAESGTGGRPAIPEAHRTSGKLHQQQQQPAAPSLKVCRKLPSNSQALFLSHCSLLCSSAFQAIGIRAVTASTLSASSFFAMHLFSGH